MLSRMTLRDKGLLFVSVFVVLELVICLVLMSMLQQAETAASEYKKADAAISRATNILTSLGKGGTCLALFAYTGDAKYGKQYDDLSSSVAADVKTLDETVSRQRRPKVKQLTGLISGILLQMNSYRHQLDNSESSPPLTEMRKKVQPALMKAADELNRYIDEEKIFARQFDHAASEDLRHNIQIMVGLLFAVSASGAFILMRLFTTRIVRRIEVVNDNALRLASDATLLPRVGGHDELSRLDDTFHKMAHALRESMEKERQAAQSLQESEQKVRAIIEHMPVGLVAIESSGQIISVNPKTAALIKSDERSLVGKHVSSLFRDQKAIDKDKFVSFVFEKALDKVIELEARTVDGHVFPVELSLNRFDSADGQLLLLTMMDVSERHEAERLKREFVAMVSHDLKTPLTSIQGSLGLVTSGATGGVNEKTADILDTAEVELKRLTRLIADLLDGEKMDAGKMLLSINRAELSSLVWRSLASIGPMAEQAGVSIICGETEALVLADEERMVQVFVNLLSNALKFSKPGDKIYVESRAIDNDWIEVRVIDQGPGIAPEHARAVFEKFYQVPEDGAKKEGSGLGLAICRQIMEQHGGSIGVRSQPGQGSAFWLRLKLAPEA